MRRHDRARLIPTQDDHATMQPRANPPASLRFARNRIPGLKRRTETGTRRSFRKGGQRGVAGDRGLSQRHSRLATIVGSPGPTR